MTFADIPLHSYNIIYADPPWTYHTYSSLTGNGQAIKHYKTMSREHIQALPVKDIAADDCVLFIWVTMPCLQEGLELIEKWGFKYKTCAFTWVKKNKISDSWFWGMGFWTRSNAELCLLATRGKPKRVSKAIHSIIESRIEKHSQKPAIVRDKIVALCGDLPIIELFARQTPVGWDCWGDEL